MRFDTPYNQRTTPPHRGTPSHAGAKGSQDTGARKWNSWWSRRSPNLVTNDGRPARIGIDAGSKTIKLVALDANGDIVFADYHRHRSDVRTALADLVHDIVWRFGDHALPIAVTGSGGIALAEALGLPFVQEVVATTNAVRSRYPQADCVIELGGEDAKITYLSGAPEHRMNATCAGGTGDFIDGIASMLGVRTREISKLAMGHQRTYPIASRCAVFAQTDVRPLINAGAAKADIAQSALEAVVRQTLGGLACGRPLRGTVVFLGGPLEHIPALVTAFRDQLGLTTETGIKPLDAHLFTAMGAVETALDAPVVKLSELEARVRRLGEVGNDSPLLPPLFESSEELRAFRERHKRGHMPLARLEDARGPLYLGFDAGSTTMKYALVDEAGAIVACDYRTVEGDSLNTAKTMLGELLLGMQGNAYAQDKRFIARAVVTGYGEDLLRCALGFDDGVVETAAHLRAARHFQPDVSFLLDIGGQDMKALWVRDGHIEDAVLNEACSSGCGAFVQSSAKSLNLSHEEFSRRALEARHGVDLGAKCTVFMTSRVRHAQKSGADVGEIAAGIAYSVVNNALSRIIGADRVATMGDKVVVQGGTFQSDAVLRAFEKAAGVHAIRPSTAHLMGAYGAALIARDQDPGAGSRSGLMGLREVRDLAPSRRSLRCTGCGNACLVSVVDFGDGRRFLSGNRCERAGAVLFGETAGTGPKAPNVVALQQGLIAAYATQPGSGGRAGVCIGLLNVLNAYEATPFWHTLIARLGFGVVVPDPGESRALQDRAAESIPSESVCHPAKVAHERYAYLAQAGADVVFAPVFERGPRCPVACRYAEVLHVNAEGPRLVMPELRAMRPQKIAADAGHVEALYECFRALCADFHLKDAPGRAEFHDALTAAVAEQASFEQKVMRAAGRALQWLARDPARRAAVLACRPYHVDPVMLHGIDRVLSNLGFAVIPASALGVSRGGKTLWKPARRLASLVRECAGNPQLEVVALRSFGCGYDAVSFDEAHDAAVQLGRPFTALKIDDIADTAHIRIRLRTLAYTSQARQPELAGPTFPAPPAAAPEGSPGAGRTAGNGKHGPFELASRALPDAEAAPRPAGNGKRDLHESAGRVLPDAEGAPRPAGGVTPDLCSTAKMLVQLALDQLDGGPASIVVPDICKNCLTDALPFELAHLLRPAKGIAVEPWPQAGQAPGASVPQTGRGASGPGASGPQAGRGGAGPDSRPNAPGNDPAGGAPDGDNAARAYGSGASEPEASPKVGLLGNPLLVFNPEANEHVADLLNKLGCETVYPDPSLISVEDVRYLDQLRAFQDAGVRSVVYLQSFGCLKGHVQSRGALRDLQKRFPQIAITVADYDPEASALNRENRIRLAVSSGR